MTDDTRSRGETDSRNGVWEWVVYVGRSRRNMGRTFSQLYERHASFAMKANGNASGGDV